jgi:hypothetical protein
MERARRAPSQLPLAQLEMHKCCHPTDRLRVYFLEYQGSSEEQQFLTRFARPPCALCLLTSLRAYGLYWVALCSIKREKSAFETLIGFKARMVIPVRPSAPRRAAVLFSPLPFPADLLC